LLLNISIWQIEQATVDLVIGEDNTVLFQAIGKKYVVSSLWQRPALHGYLHSTLYLTGNYIGSFLFQRDSPNVVDSEYPFSSGNS
jgi:hypothetical protein